MDRLRYLNLVWFNSLQNFHNRKNYLPMQSYASSLMEKGGCAREEHAWRRFLCSVRRKKRDYGILQKGVLSGSLATLLF